jgi:hypothetical protein
MCLLRGTNIQTAAGQRKIADLVIGDLLPTVFGGIRPIQWIGRYPMKKSDPSRPWAKEALPVQLARSALAPDVPHADLFVTGRHGLLIDGLLIPAANLRAGCRGMPRLYSSERSEAMSAADCHSFAPVIRHRALRDELKGSDRYKAAMQKIEQRAKASAKRGS